MKASDSCPECPSVFTTVRTLNRHRMNVHNIRDRKFCSRCLEEKPATQFARRSGKQGKPQTTRGPCLSCESEDRYGSPEKLEHWRRVNYFSKKMREYGVAEEELVAIYESQDGSCATCGEPSDMLDLRLDHDHETGAIRGYLCVACNVGLGSFRDDPKRLIRASEYLEKKPHIMPKRWPVSGVGWRERPHANARRKRGPVRKDREETF